MLDLISSRDCIVFVRDDTMTVVVDDTMVRGGWPGGQGVQWVGTVADEFLVTYSSGKFGGFLVWGSDESADDFAATTRNQPHYRFATMLFGTSLFSTSSYEHYTLASRLSPPLIPLVYEENQLLYLSLRGLWTNENELSPGAPPPSAGVVAQVPGPWNKQFLGVQTMM